VNLAQPRYEFKRDLLCLRRPWHETRPGTAEINMSAIQIELPDKVRERAEELARDQGISLDRFMVVALVEKLSTMFPNEFIEERAKRGTWEGFDQFMEGVPDVDPEPPDEPRK
jgi:hypothetical protein